MTTVTIAPPDPELGGGQHCPGKRDSPSQPVSIAWIRSPTPSWSNPGSAERPSCWAEGKLKVWHRAPVEMQGEAGTAKGALEQGSTGVEDLTLGETDSRSKRFIFSISVGLDPERQMRLVLIGKCVLTGFSKPVCTSEELCFPKVNSPDVSFQSEKVV